MGREGFSENPDRFALRLDPGIFLHYTHPIGRKGGTRVHYDFDRLPERKGTGSVKWDGTSIVFGSDEVLPMWVADMDFPAAQPIVEALKKKGRASLLRLYATERRGL